MEENEGQENEQEVVEEEEKDDVELKENQGEEE